MRPMRASTNCANWHQRKWRRKLETRLCKRVRSCMRPGFDSAVRTNPRGKTELTPKAKGVELSVEL